ncbi:unnamed protein product [Brassicogethes aeneus]|uniref:DNA topoisomerase (ATP-hydrolyzing) n=1 Tax=Brassicogethes aeneus TaxID=1431903 RepID=A0A9P0FHB2_BRAAE|nr:unnamed protein product [Brassicogethes aeneus]
MSTKIPPKSHYSFCNVSSSFESHNSDCEAQRDMLSIGSKSYATQFTSTPTKPNKAGEPSTSLDEFFLSLISEESKGNKKSKTSSFASRNETKENQNPKYDDETSTSSSLYADLITGISLKPFSSKSKKIQIEKNKNLISKTNNSSTSESESEVYLKTKTSSFSSSSEIIKTKKSKKATSKTNDFNSTTSSGSEVYLKTKTSPFSSSSEIIKTKKSKKATSKTNDFNSTTSSLSEGLQSFFDMLDRPGDQKLHKTESNDQSDVNLKPASSKSKIIKIKKNKNVISKNNNETSTSESLYTDLKSGVDLRTKKSFLSSCKIIKTKKSKKVISKTNDYKSTTSSLSEGLQSFFDMLDRPGDKKLHETKSSDQSDNALKFLDGSFEPPNNKIPKLSDKDVNTSFIDQCVQNKKRKKQSTLDSFFRKTKPSTERRKFITQVYQKTFGNSNTKGNNNNEMGNICIKNDNIIVKEPPQIEPVVTKECNQIVYPAEQSFTLTKRIHLNTQANPRTYCTTNIEKNKNNKEISNMLTKECNQIVYPGEKSFTLTSSKVTNIDYVPEYNNNDKYRVINSDNLLQFTESLRKDKPNKDNKVYSNKSEEKTLTNSDNKIIVSSEKQSELFLQSLLSSKKVDVHEALLKYFNIQENTGFDYLRTAMEETSFRFMSDKMLHKESKGMQVSTKKRFFKRYVKGNTKLYLLNVVKKKTIIDEPKVQDKDDLDDFFYQFTQEEVGLLDRTYKSFSSDVSFVTHKSGESGSLSSGSQVLTRHQMTLRSGINDVLKNKDFLYNSEDEQIFEEIGRKEIVEKIENIFLEVLDNFENNRKPTFRYRRQCWENCVFKNGRCQFKKNSAMQIIYYNRKASCKRFCLMFYLLDQIRKLLLSDTTLTKREIYYQIKKYVQNQGITDSCIMAVSCLLNVGPWDLNIVAQKGLVFGNLKLKLTSGEVINCNVPGTTIPLNVKDITKIETSCYFILVVEKESIFHKLIQEDLPNSLTRPFIMITGKGFPDHNTLLFVKKLWVVLSVPVFILVDPDPQGIQIMLNYRVGSLTSAHLSHQLAIPKAQWLGVFPTEIVKYSLRAQELTNKDIKTVKDMLLLPHIRENEKIKHELQFLLDRKYKSEIEALTKSETYMSRIYFTEKMIRKNFI